MRDSSLLIPVVLLGVALLPRPSPHVPSPPEVERVVVYLDGYLYPEHREDMFGYPSNEVFQRNWASSLDLESAGLSLEDVCRSARWYEQVWATARDLGFQAVAWQIPRGETTVPSEQSVDLLGANDLAVAPFVDLKGEAAGSDMSRTRFDAEDVVRRVDSFNAWVAPGLRLRLDGRPVVFLRTAGESTPDETGWESLRRGLRVTLGEEPLVYWLEAAGSQVLMARLHEAGWLRPLKRRAAGDHRGKGIFLHYALDAMRDGAVLLPWSEEGRARGRAVADRMRGVQEEEQSARWVTVVVDDLCHPDRSSAPRAWRELEAGFLREELDDLLPWHRLRTWKGLAEQGLDGGPIVVLADPAAAETRILRALARRRDVLFYTPGSKRWGERRFVVEELSWRLQVFLEERG